MKINFLKLFILINLIVQAQFQEHFISSSNYARVIVSADIDGDNDNDIIITGNTNNNNQLSWIENSNSLGNFNTLHSIINNSWDKGGYIAITDIDNDNDNDILVSTNELDNFSIRTCRNTNGIGDFEIAYYSMSTSGNLSSIIVGDIDGDNDLDWISSASASEFHTAKLSWFENHSSTDGTVTEHLINNNYLISYQLTDIDGDGDTDIVGLGQNTFWYENIDGLGNFSIEHIINNAQNINYYSKIINSDIDNDGDQDIITTFNNIVSLYKNDGQGNFSTEINISNSQMTKRNTLAVDLDTDGFIDLLSTGDNNAIMFYKNDGQGNFTEEIIIDNLYYNNSPIFAIDINGDNKMDIISSSSQGQKISWYENLGILSINQNNTIDFSISPNPSSKIIEIKSETKISNVKVYNSLGSLVTTNKNNRFNISYLSKGLYYVKIIGLNGEFSVKKLIKN